MTNPLQAFRLWRSRSRRARLELAKRLRTLFKQALPFSLGGIHEWQLDNYDHGLMPAVDVVFSELHFSFLKPSGGPFGPLLPRRRILEEAFRRRLVHGNDLVPVLPIFINPVQVLRLRDESLFIAYLDECWHEAILWALKQIPAVSTDQQAIVPGTMDSRRSYLEEAAKLPFFQLLSQ